MLALVGHGDKKSEPVVRRLLSFPNLFMASVMEMEVKKNLHQLPCGSREREREKR